LNKQVVATLRKLARETRNGVLTCQDDGISRFIVMSEGGIVGARSTINTERLGEVLLRKGLITKQQFDDVSIFVKKGRPMGQILIEFGIIKEEDLETYLRFQFLEISSSAVLRTQKGMSFSPSDKPQSDLASPIHVLDVVMEAARREPKIDAYINKLMGDERLLSLTDKSMKLMETVTLQPEEAFILSRVNGEEPPKSVFELSPLPEEQTARAILGHIFVGILELKENPNLHGLALRA
jgi:hypothetical protein